MFKKTMAVTVFALLVVGCGGGKPLTDEQKAQFSATMQSAGRGPQAALKARGAAPLMAVSLGSAVRTAAPDQKVDEMAAKMQGICEITYSPAKSSDMSFSLTAGGGNCPVDLSQRLNMQVSGQSLSATFDMSYLVKNQEFAALNDVFSMTLKGSVQASSSGASIDFNGAIKSALYGEIPITIRGSGDSGGLEMTMKVTFPTFAVEMKVKATSGSAEYTLNGQSLSKEEFQNYFPSGTGLTGNPTTGGPGALGSVIGINEL